MAKNTRGSKEYSREQKLSKENKQLKREIARLQKILSRIDLEGLEATKQLCFEQEEKERLNESLGDISSNISDLRKKWECNECHNGWLEISLYSKAGQTWYYRKCSSCEKRTKGKKYDSGSVKGIIKNGQF